MKFINELLRLLFGWIGWRRDSQRAEAPPDGVPAPERDPVQPKLFDGAWMKLARTELGVAEIPGEENNPRVIEYYKDAGHGWVKADSTAWCAAFVGSVLERSGYSSSKSLAARSYLTWGKKLSKPKEGCIVVFSRGDPNGWQGHVGFYVSETATHIKVLGGNQGDKVSIASYPKSRLLGYRWPVTAFNSRTNVAGVVGATSSAVSGGILAAFSITDTLSIANTLKALGPLWWLIFVALGISVFSHFFSMWARADDLAEKGR